MTDTESSPRAAPLVEVIIDDPALRALPFGRRLRRAAAAGFFGALVAAMGALGGAPLLANLGAKPLPGQDLQQTCGPIALGAVEDALQTFALAQAGCAAVGFLLGVVLAVAWSRSQARRLGHIA